MRCHKCDAEVRDSECNCPRCYHFCGYPNVRAAQKPEEQDALNLRLRAAQASAAARGCGDTLTQFQRAAKSSRAVLCRRLSQVMQLVSSDNELYASFYELVGIGTRRPEDTDTERERLLADDLLFPHFREKIRFAALSLDGRGATSYGNCSLVLRDDAIRDRATVFEGNSLHFCKDRGLGLGKPVPPGYRAAWDERDHLAAAKLEPLLEPGTKPEDFPKILLRVSGKPPREDFVEVHIYGPLSRQGIERLVAGQPKRKADRAILKEVGRKLKAPEVGATVEVTK